MLFKTLVKLSISLPIKFIFFVLDLLVPKRNDYFVLASKSGRNKDEGLFQLAKVLERKGSVFLTGTDRFNIFSLTSFWKILRAKYVFLTHGPGDILYALYSPRKVVTYVGHGGPLKNFIFTNKHMNMRDRINHKIESRFYRFFLASSEAEKEVLQKCFACSEDKILVTGLPRNELLLTQSDELNSQNKFKKVVLYAPTYRAYCATRLFPFADKDLEKLNAKMKRENICIYLKLHPNEASLFKKEYSHLKPFPKHVGLYSVLNEVDVLVTDYSSLIFDFLLLDRPIVYLDYDLEEYSQKRGFLHPYEEIAIGAHPKSQTEFIDRLLDDEWREKRQALKKVFHQYESDFAKRVADLIIV